MQNKSIAVFLITAIFTFLFSIHCLAEGEVVLSLGRSQEIKLDRQAHVSVANGAIVHVIDLGHSIKLVGIRIGHTAIHIGNNSSNTEEIGVTVFPESTYRIYDALARALQNRRGLKLTVQGEVCVVQGRLLRFSDWQALAKVANDFPLHSFQFSAELDEKVAIEARGFFNRLLRETGLPVLQLSFQPRATLNIPSESEGIRTRAETVFAKYGFSVVVNPLAISIEPMVRVQILVAEFRKSFMHHFGLQWPASLNGQLLPSPHLDGGQDLTISLQAMENSGAGKILASPTLLCRSGKEASFLAGGEIPIKVSSFKMHDVVWKQYGVLLHIAPRADSSGHMSIAITTEVSEPGGVTVDGIPGMLSNRIDTHFDLSATRTIALSGLIKHDWAESRQGLPSLSQIPILGALFSSQEYKENQTELVIFVTPSIEEQI